MWVLGLVVSVFGWVVWVLGLVVAWGLVVNCSSLRMLYYSRMVKSLYEAHAVGITAVVLCDQLYAVVLVRLTCLARALILLLGTV